MFMKGTPDAPRDGYQAEAVTILSESKVRYTSVDVLEDPDVREILKEFSRFTSYP
jgi:monothiol glutaredoxin